MISKKNTPKSLFLFYQNNFKMKDASWESRLNSLKKMNESVQLFAPVSWTTTELEKSSNLFWANWKISQFLPSLKKNGMNFSYILLILLKMTRGMAFLGYFSIFNLYLELYYVEKMLNCTKDLKNTRIKLSKISEKKIFG